MIELLQKLLLDRTKEINLRDKEILDLIESAYENIAIAETTVVSKVHNPMNEALSVLDTLTVQSINYAVKFVAGPYIWSGEGSGDHKRVFDCDGSHLG